MGKVFFFILIGGFTAICAFADDASSNKAHTRLMKMSDPERNVALGRFLKASKESCEGVVRNFYQGAAKDGTAFWNAACRNQKMYVISISNDAKGSTKIMDCNMMKLVAKIECFTKLKD